MNLREKLMELITEAKRTDPEDAPFSEYLVDFLIANGVTVQVEQENPKPLTLDELRKMDAPVWCLCKPIEGGNGYWCICQKGTIITPAGFSYDVEETQNWVFLRSKPKEDV